MKILRSICLFYWDGFRSMTLGKTLWKIIFIKLIIILFVVKYLFYYNDVKKMYPTEQMRAEHFRKELLKTH